MNLLKLLTRIIEYVNKFIKIVTNLEKKKKNIYIELKLDVR